MLQTILSGVVVFVLGQIAVKLIVDPVQKMKRTLGEIAHALVYFAGYYSNPGAITPEWSDEASESFRKLSAELHADLRNIPFYSICRWVFGLPSLVELRTAQSDLIGLSNGTRDRSWSGAPFYNLLRAQHVSDALGIYTPAHERVPEELVKELIARNS